MLLRGLVLAGCSTVVGANSVKEYNQRPLTVNMPHNLSPEEVEEAMGVALRYRGWTVVQQSPQEVIGERNCVNFQVKATLRPTVSLKSSMIPTSNTAGPRGDARTWDYEGLADESQERFGSGFSKKG
jgi:hypothetical protein